jgi:hypothetical protein
MPTYNLLSVNADAKTSKGTSFGFLTGILYMSPANQSGYEVCFWRSQGCTMACLDSAGRGAFKNVREARFRKTKMFHEQRQEFMNTLRSDILKLVKEANSKNMTPCVRLNGTSDLPWEVYALELMQEFPQVKFYDYTKGLTRMLRFCQGKMPENYHLTFSKSEENWKQCLQVLKAGGNVAAVFSGIMPDKYEEYEVINGDESDLRFLDKPRTIIGLKAKGKAKKDTTGFVLRVINA